MSKLPNQIPEFSDDAFVRDVDICALRQELGFSQLEMADEIGTGRTTISKYESGLHPIAGSAQRIYWRLFHELKFGLRQPSEKAGAAR